ncbi:MAG: TRAP transporter small permease subunit [Gammaproteobacteria bacterium]|nr:TRAP transporter small permease subunit [Gammaproteobacteria bacterium]
MKVLLESVVEWTGKCVSWLLLLMAIVTVIVVTRRYIFHAGGEIYLQESVIYMHALVFMFGLSYSMKHDGHVRVDLFYSRFSPRGKALVDIAGHLLFLIPTSLVIAIFSWEYVVASWKVYEGSREVGGIPGVYLLKTVIPITAILLVLQSLIDISRRIADLRNK